MGSTIKRPFRTFNGADWDTHYFDTSEDMIKSGWIIGSYPADIFIFLVMET